MKTNTIKSGLIIILCLFSLVLAFDVSAGSKFTSLAKHQTPFTQQDIRITAKAYEEKESVSYLNQNINKSGYQPIQVTIENDTPRSLSISRSGFNFPTTAPDEVVTQVSKSSLPRSIGFTVASFLFWPFSIASTANSLVTYKGRRNLTRDLNAKGVKDEVILPFSTVNRVVFVKKSQEMPNKLTLTLIDVNTLKQIECEAH